jgi:hypothetical protein
MIRKKVIMVVGCYLLSIGLWAQSEDGVKIVSVSQAIQTTAINPNFSIQVGLPYLGQNKNSHRRTTTPLDIRFPFDILYLYPTFTDAEGSFDISKGYFGDNIQISWIIRNNSDLITMLKLYRRVYTGEPVAWSEANFIANIPVTDNEYEDKYEEGGVLYEYKLVAEGVSETEKLYDTYITGIGFRTPTAIVTGNVSYDGGAPVKDVVVTATSEGGAISFGSALDIPRTGGVEIEGLDDTISTEGTFQAWVKPKTPYTTDTQTAITLFSLDSSLGYESSIDVTIKLFATSNILQINIDGSLINLNNYYPSGTLNSRGDDQLVSVADFNNNFVHISVIIKNGLAPSLFINGRAISEEYETDVNTKLIGIDPNYTAPYFDVVLGTPNTNSFALTNQNSQWDKLTIGGGADAIIDEIRIWNTVIDTVAIRTDYSRYISGNSANLISYLSANENVGDFAYDFSRNGFNYNKNNGKLVSTTWVSGAGNLPAVDQLGVLGVTDEYGNYQINAIPYSGTGESYRITPMYGQHNFEPGQQLVFLGQGSEVVNKIDFKDKSSFIFKGKVLYDTKDVFAVMGKVNGPGILDPGYNYYLIGNLKYSKGEYWLNDNGTPSDISDDYLDQYATIFSEDVNVYIDGNIVLNDFNEPVVTDKDGLFEVNVPIGNHVITVKKQGHEFSYNGRYPAAEGTSKEFFEDAYESVTFVDETRVTVVGRVVGGSVESQRVIGFGQDGLFQKSVIAANGVQSTVTVSSKNNIGVAAITLGYKPSGSPATAFTKANFTTNKESGEYRIELLPLDYELVASDLTIPSATIAPISILAPGTAENLSFSDVAAVTTPTYKFEDETTATGEPYNYEKSFTYRSAPVAEVVSQTHDENIDINGTLIPTAGFTTTGNDSLYVYSQFANYKVVLNRFERYTNYDDPNAAVEDFVTVTDGELIINNNFALADSELIEVDPNDESVMTYSFKGGLPAISSPFTLLSSLNYRINGTDYPVANYINHGLILGGQSDGTQTFVTAAPDRPDIILRDPPGSNSFASIEQGTSFTFTTESSFADQEGTEDVAKILLGVYFEAGGGLAGPMISSEVEDTSDLGIGLSRTSTDGKSLTKTYTFNKTISTSDDPDYVGSDGDLYIGKSTNQFYGSFNDVQASTAQIGTSVSLQLVNSTGTSVYISTQKAVYFVDEPSETFFVFSQKHILTTLIPEYELFISNINNGLLIPGVEGTLEIEQYEEQIRLWKKVISDNEKSKYLAKNEREKYKTSLADVITAFSSEIEKAISANDDDPDAESYLIHQLNESTNISTLLNEHFDDNISFDAGVGEVTNSVETAIISTKATQYNLTIDENFALEWGFNVNRTGVVNTLNSYFQQGIDTSLAQEDVAITNISYTLKDNDPANLLSVDVVNSFDGNGPIFITQGGSTSCPYEGAEESKFFTEAKFKDYFTEYWSIQDSNSKTKEEDLAALDLEFSNDTSCCETDAKAPLSFATQHVENIQLTIEGPNSRSNVPEGSNAEFTLKLENLSDIIDPEYSYYNLVIDNTTNPNNALINISPQGNSLFIPFGKPVYYKLTLGKSISDVYDYENITIRLESDCDPDNVSSEATVSASFIPSCTEITVSAPLNNWMYNVDEAYNTDGSTKPLVINLTGFNTDFDSFEKIVLEYRAATSPNWSRLQSYYGTQENLTNAIAGGEGDNILIDNSSLNYSFYIASKNLQDGNYEIRARTICTTTEFISEVITGRVDLHAPQKFGTPLPIDGILGAGEDLEVNFNENIFYNSATSNIQVQGKTNQGLIDHNISLRFEGTENTAVINNPKVTTGDLTIEFWMNNSTQAAMATVVDQNGGLKIGLDNNDISFELGGLTAKGTITNDNLFHHYTFTHKSSTSEISIYEDAAVIASNTASSNLSISNSNALVIGGNTFIGNIHDFRIWNKSISLEDAYAKMYNLLVGNEANLIGYWPMDEGDGTIAHDKARFKHAILSASWSIKPQGTSYQFENGQYLSLDNVGFVQISNEMDATISFWIKTDVSQDATIFSNGKGDGTDVLQSNGFGNKWAINMNSSGMLSFENEGKSYTITTKSVADGIWHHVALLFNRLGSLRSYVDAEPVTSNAITTIGGFSGNKIWLGARGQIDLAGIETVDRPFTGKIDEFRLWNTLRNEEQVSRDRYYEVNFDSPGLLLYARMNAPDPVTANGPRYYHEDTNQTVIPSDAVLSSGAVNYSNDDPAIKPERELINFDVDYVIDGDKLIITPKIDSWALLEGQVIDISVERMYDDANNAQQSPITWTAYVERNDVSWFADGYNEIVDIVKNSGEEKSFVIAVLNKGGKVQPFNISNIPSWLKLSKTSGTINPDSQINITASIDKELTAGEYDENIFLQTDYGHDEKLHIKVKELAQAPDWTVDPSLYSYSMSIVGKIKIDGKFSEDYYDKIAAFYNGEIRGITNLIYNSAYQEYFAFLTVYSNATISENIEFKIWDSSQGEVILATVDNSSFILFEENGVQGRLSLPVIFENSDLLEQKIDLNKGWSWISVNVNDNNFSDLNQLTNSLNLKTNDRILSHLSGFDTYTDNTLSNTGWSGQITNSGGLTNTEMYKVYMANDQVLMLTGVPVDISSWTFLIETGWNWLPYPLLGNRLTKEALAYFDANDGDVIKSQNSFAIYDPIVGWNGTLNYLKAGQGYMLNSSSNTAQSFKYPSYLAQTAKINPAKKDIRLADSDLQTIKPEFTKYAANMNAVVSLPQGYSELFAYDASGVLKGAALNQEVNGKALSFITVYGESSETLVFYIGDGTNEKRTSKNFSFKGNDILGTINKPIIIEEIINYVKIFPNPFDNEITLKVNADKDQIVSIQLYSLTGQMVFDKKQNVVSGENVLKIQPKVASGAYLLQIEINGEKTVNKVMKN